MDAPGIFVPAALITDNLSVLINNARVRAPVDSVTIRANAFIPHKLSNGVHRVASITEECNCEVKLPPPPPPRPSEWSPHRIANNALA